MRQSTRNANVSANDGFASHETGRARYLQFPSTGDLITFLFFFGGYRPATTNQNSMFIHFHVCV